MRNFTVMAVLLHVSADRQDLAVQESMPSDRRRTVSTLPNRGSWGEYTWPAAPGRRKKRKGHKHRKRR